MDLAQPLYVFRDEIFAARPERAAGIRFAGLWVAGNIDCLAQPTAAIVGSRAPSEGGRSRARSLAAALSARGVCVISGLAHGIDAAAHQGAVDGAKPTVGILGGGHRHFFPKRNLALAEDLLASGGAVLSPFAPDEPARPPQFLQRNAVVASLADVVIVVEAAERSGALNTAGWANDLGITVLAFPGDVDRPVSAGCNKLIRDGATLVRGAEDVFEAMGTLSGPPLPTVESVIRDRYRSEPDVLAVLRALGTEPRSLDTVARATGFTAGETMSLLIRLEVEGAIERRDLMEYVLVS